ncbi:MAG: site-specific integrase [Sphingobacteriales bacterium]|nr:MAG: site-specific integrase [Sphingobacteriales bacterium]
MSQKMKSPKPYCIERRVRKSDGTATYRVKIRTQFGKATRTFDRLSDAKQWAENTKVEMRRGDFVDYLGKRRTQVSLVIDRYLNEYIATNYGFLEVQRRRTELERWRAEVGQLAIGALSASHISHVRDKMLGENTQRGVKRSPSSVRRSLAILSHMLNVAVVEWEMIPANPVNRIKKPKTSPGRIRFLSPEELEKLLYACQKSSCRHLLPLVVLAVSTGARRGELMNLRWQDVDWEQGVIRLLKTKNGHPRSIPLAGKAHAMLKEKFVQESTNSEFVFARFDGEEPMELEKHWQRAMKHAGLENFRFHDLRHTAASYLAMNKATLMEIAAVLGHRTLQMVQRYSHLTEQHTAEVVRKMNERMFATSATPLLLDSELGNVGGFGKGLSADQNGA